MNTHTSVINTFELQQMLTVSSTWLHVRTLNLNAGQLCSAENFPASSPLSSATFNSETLFGFRWSFQKSFEHRSPDISAGRGFTFSDLGGHCFFWIICKTVLVQALLSDTCCAYCAEFYASRWTCRSVRSGSSRNFAVFNRWKLVETQTKRLATANRSRVSILVTKLWQCRGDGRPCRIVLSSLIIIQNIVVCCGLYVMI